MSFSNDSLTIIVSQITLFSHLLDGLKALQRLGLIAEQQLNFQTSGDSYQGSMGLKIKAQISISELVECLTVWQERGLLTDPQLDCEIMVVVSTLHPALLEGLEYWLELGLLSDPQVKQICKTHLTCNLPEVLPQKRPISFVEETERRPNRVGQFAEGTERRPNRVGQILQSLMAELSVVWLLLLGVFMVVSSSGVLAASQWGKFPAAGQYSILWFYTLGFGGASFWAITKPNLHLTAQALRIVTLLLVPINFIAMDSFGLWHNPLDLLIISAAVLSLIVLTRQLYGSEPFSQFPPTPQLPISPPLPHNNLGVHSSLLRGESDGLSLFNLLGLSLLHLGWAIDWVPLGATYTGVLLTTVLTLLPHRDTGEKNPFSLNGALIVYAESILLIRAIFISHVEITQLGLAAGLCGWLMIWQTQHQGLWREIGGSLIALGWLLSVGGIPAQALIISFLALSVALRRLLLSWLRFDLGTLWLIGLETIWLGWRLIPIEGQQAAITFLTRLTDSENTPWSLLSTVFFPYLLLMLLVSDWLDQQEKGELSRFGYLLALLFGSILISLSLVNPLLGSFNFLGSTIVLSVITQRNLTPGRSLFRQIAHLALLTQITGLLSLILTIDWLFPNLSLGVWATILLGLMLLEGLFSLRNFSSNSLLFRLGQSAFGLAISLAMFSYALLLVNQIAVLNGLTFLFPYPVVPWLWGTLWLITPISLTAVANWVINKRQSASLLSVYFLFLGQILTLFTAETRFIGLGVATILMLVNTRNFPYLGTAIISVGFGLALFCQTLLEIFPVSESGWLLLIVFTIALLWLLRHWLSSKPNRLSALYGQSTDIYAVLLCSFSLVVFLFNQSNITNLILEDPKDILLAILCLIAATTYRSWQRPQSPEIIWLSIITLLIVQIPLSQIGPLFGFGIATGLMLFHTHLSPKIEVAAITVGFGLGFVGISLWDTIKTLHSPSGLLLIGAILLMGLWTVRSVLLSRQTQLVNIYIASINAWAIFLCSLELFLLTCHSLLVYWRNIEIKADGLSVSASLLTFIAITYRNWQYPNNRTIYALGFSLELLVIEVLGFWEDSRIALGIVNIVLGIVTQLLGDWLQRRSQRETYLSSWQILPLLYGGLGTALRWGVFNSWTGLNTLGLVLILIGVGRRQEGFKPLLYLGVMGFSLSAYELLLYEVAGLPRGTQFLAMATLATSIMYAYRLLIPFLTDFLKLTPNSLKTIAHLHWGLGSFCLILAIFFPVEVNQMVGVGVFLTSYAIFQGRNHPNLNIGEIWIYLGFIEGVVISAYTVQGVPILNTLSRFFIPWSGILEAILGVVIYLLPWGDWGYSRRPWRLIAMLLPLMALVFSDTLQAEKQMKTFNLLGVAGFYAGLAYVREQPRLTYLSLLLVDWVILSWISAPFIHASLGGLACLYIAWKDPQTRRVECKPLRHFLRLLGTGIICGSGLLFYSDTGILPGILALIAIFAGLALHIRAFLYIGTISLVADTFYQSVILITHYPIFKWIIGLIIGLSFISLAANFETRREQITTLLRNWLNELAEWE